MWIWWNCVIFKPMLISKQIPWIVRTVKKKGVGGQGGKSARIPLRLVPQGKNSFLISQLVTSHDLAHLRKAFQAGSSCNWNVVCLLFHWCLCEAQDWVKSSLNSLTYGSKPEITLFPFLPLQRGPKKPVAAVEEWRGRVASFTLWRRLFAWWMFLSSAVPTANQSDWYGFIPTEFKITKIKSFLKRPDLK